MIVFCCILPASNKARDDDDRVMRVQACTVEDFLSSPSAAKLEHLGEDRGKILVEFLGVSVCVCVCACMQQLSRLKQSSTEQNSSNL